MFINCLACGRVTGLTVAMWPGSRRPHFLPTIENKATMPVILAANSPHAEDQ